MKWAYLEKLPAYVETIPSGFEANGIPLILPKSDLSPKAWVQHLKEHQPDVILTSGWSPFHQDDYLNAIRQYCHETGSLHVFWSFEDPLHTDIWGMYMVETGRPDVVFTHALGASATYRETGVPAYYLPFACNPRIHRSDEYWMDYQSDIALVANFSNNTMDCDRINSLRLLLEPVIKQGYPLSIWGEGWEEGRRYLPFSLPKQVIRGAIPYRDVPKVYASAKVVLGIQNDSCILSRRTWECMGSGGFLLAPHTPAVLHHFQPGTHLVTTQSPEETARLVRHYLSHPQERKRIAKNGQTNVYQQHTYRHRIQTMNKIVTEMLDSKRKGKRVYSLSSRLKQEIRPYQIDSTHSHKISWLEISRKTASRLQSQACLWFDLMDENASALELVSAKLNLYLLSKPEGNPRLRYEIIQPDQESERVVSVHEKEIAFSLDSRYPYHRYWVSLSLTEEIREWKRNGDRFLGVRLSVHPQDVGAIRIMGKERPRVPPLSNLDHYRRFIPRLEIIYEGKSGPWHPFRQ